ncbi:hypothetical protein BW897_26835 [Bacillus cereus]|uniref:Uncharacterized protein n=1 Tax=Bacillus cereus TaxID=1396 RepID=A0A1S9TI56_BACCE|nr:hypothetical protein [Bacillus cereus]OOR09602.1 hypothetical protein BW897_26835 [Bacillus cereus]
MSRTGKRGKAKLGRTNIEVTQLETYTFQELFNIYMFAKEAEGLARIEYFEREDLYEYIYEYCNALAEKIFEQGQHSKAGTYFYKAIQAKKKADAKGALK